MGGDSSSVDLRHEAAGELHSDPLFRVTDSSDGPITRGSALYASLPQNL